MSVMIILPYNIRQLNLNYSSSIGTTRGDRYRLLQIVLSAQFVRRFLIV